MDYMQLIITVTGLAGHYFVAKKNPIGYAFWIIGNIAMIAESLDKGMYMLVALFLVYTGISLWAMRSWIAGNRDQRADETAPAVC